MDEEACRVLTWGWGRLLRAGGHGVHTTVCKHVRSHGVSSKIGIGGRVGRMVVMPGGIVGHVG